MNRTKILLFSSIFILLTSFTVYFISKEKYIYLWDYAGYWNMTKELSGLLRNNVNEAYSRLIYSIRNEEYNLLFAVPLGIFNNLFSKTRVTYILSILIVYAFPSIILFTALIERMISKVRKPTFFDLYIPIISISLLPQFLQPILLGFPDVGGNLIIFLLLILYFKVEFEKQTVYNILLMALLLVTLGLFRRWYFIWIFSFSAVLIMVNLVLAYLKYRLNFKYYVRTLQNFSLLNLSLLALLFMIAGPLVNMIIRTDYAYIYTPGMWNFSLTKSVLELINTFGIAGVVLFLIGIRQTLSVKKLRSISVFLLLQLFLAVFLFLKMHDFGSTHYYLVLPTIVFFITYCVLSFIENAKPKKNKFVLVVLYSLYVVANFSFAYVPNVSLYFKPVAFLFTNRREQPLVRNDLSELNRLFSTIQNIINSEKTSVYVLSSSFTLNDDILRNICYLKKKYNLCEQILFTHHWDKRDGAPVNFFKAKYIVISQPIGFHTRREEQRVVGILAEQMLQGYNIGQYYRKMPHQFNLDNNTKVFIYRREKPLSKQSIRKVSLELKKYYPHDKNIYELNENSSL